MLKVSPFRLWRRIRLTVFSTAPEELAQTLILKYPLTFKQRDVDTLKKNRLSLSDFVEDRDAFFERAGWLHAPMKKERMQTFADQVMTSPLQLQSSPFLASTGSLVADALRPTLKLTFGALAIACVVLVVSSRVEAAEKEEVAASEMGSLMKILFLPDRIHRIYEKAFHQKVANEIASKEFKIDPGKFYLGSGFKKDTQGQGDKEAELFTKIHVKTRKQLEQIVIGGSPQCAIVVGERGSGKSWMVQNLVQNRKRVLYFHLEGIVSADSLAEQMENELHIGAVGSWTSQLLARQAGVDSNTVALRGNDRLRSVFVSIEKAILHSNHEKKTEGVDKESRVIIVFDDLNCLSGPSREQQDTLRLLMQFAKRWSREKIASVVFTCSDRLFATELTGISRLDGSSHVINVDALDPNEAK
jgi:archaellum biogenesis ATPase FlaH